MSVIGSISIRDNASAVLRGIKKEQASFREDVKKTRKEMKDAWDKKYQAKLDASPASRELQKLKSRMEPFKKKVVTAMAVKDMASDKVKTVTNNLKQLGKKVITPVVKLKDATAQGLSAIGGGLKNIAKSVVIPVTIAAATATTAIVGGAVSQGANLEQSIGGVETLFKGDAGVVKANAAAAFQAAGLSANEYMEQVTSFSASLISSLGGDTAAAAKAADMAMTDMADNANKFGTDMGSIQNAYQGFAKQNYTMLDNLKLGYGGTKEEMQRLLKDAQTLAGVQYDISNLSDVYHAIHAVQENLGVTGTTAKEAGATFSGSFGAMKAAAQNVLGNMAIGGDITGSMEQLVNTASTFLFQNAVPMIGSVISALPTVIQTAIKSGTPALIASGGEIVNSLKTGIISILPSSLGGIAGQIFAGFGDLGSGFSAIVPQLASFGTGMITTLQQVAGACVPLLTGIISTVQTMLPVILPVIQTVVSTIGSIMTSAAPIISGLVSGIGTVVSALAPVFTTVFSGIGEKVGSVLAFVGERMGFIQDIIGTVAPLIGDIISTAWGVISPVIDIVISVFKILFSVVQFIFPGIQKVLEVVWGIIKPIVEGIGSVIGKIAGWFGSVADAISGSGADSDSVGENAEGDNNWKGGVTWVGEKGPELVDLPRGSRILPHKESVSLMQNGGVVKNSTAKIVQSESGGNTDLSPLLALLTSIDANFKRLLERAGTKAGNISVTIAKLADEIIVREEGDIDKIADRVAKKVTEVAVNMG